MKLCFMFNAQAKNPQNPRFSRSLGSFGILVFSHFEISEFLRSWEVE